MTRAVPPVRTTMPSALRSKRDFLARQQPDEKPEADDKGDAGEDDKL